MVIKICSMFCLLVFHCLNLAYSTSLIHFFGHCSGFLNHHLYCAKFWHWVPVITESENK